MNQDEKAALTRVPASGSRRTMIANARRAESVGRRRLRRKVRRQLAVGNVLLRMFVSLEREYRRKGMPL